jgi:hypothetical protein
VTKSVEFFCSKRNDKLKEKKSGVQGENRCVQISVRPDREEKERMKEELCVEKIKEQKEDKKIKLQGIINANTVPFHYSGHNLWTISISTLYVSY